MNEKILVVGYGRFNPPTIGHDKVFDSIVKEAREVGGKCEVWTTETTDKKKNPLTPQEKVLFLEKIAKKRFPVILAKGGLIAELKRHSPLEKFILYAGSDRLGEYEKLLEKYNHKEFEIGEIEVKSSGNRENSISATQLRQSALDGDEKFFLDNTSKNLTVTEKRSLYNLVAQKLKLAKANSRGKKPLKENFSQIELLEEYIEVSRCNDLINFLKQEGKFKTLSEFTFTSCERTSTEDYSKVPSVYNPFGSTVDSVTTSWKLGFKSTNAPLVYWKSSENLMSDNVIDFNDFQFLKDFVKDLMPFVDMLRFGMRGMNDEDIEKAEKASLNASQLDSTREYYTPANEEKFKYITPNFTFTTTTPNTTNAFGKPLKIVEIDIDVKNTFGNKPMKVNIKFFTPTFEIMGVINDDEYSHGNSREFVLGELSFSYDSKL